MSEMSIQDPSHDNSRFCDHQRITVQILNFKINVVLRYGPLQETQAFIHIIIGITVRHVKVKNVPKFL